MKFSVTERGDRLQVMLTSRDRWGVDFEVALYLGAEDAGWKVKESRENRFHFDVQKENDFLAMVKVDDDLKPPVKVTIENRKADAETWLPTAKDSVREVTRVLIEKCASRGVLSQEDSAKALSLINRQQQEVRTNG